MGRTASKGELRPVTRRDLDTVRAMVRRCGVYDESDDVVQEVMTAFALYARALVVSQDRTPAEARRCVLWGFVLRHAARHHAKRGRRRARGEEPVRTTQHGSKDDRGDLRCETAPSPEDRILHRARLAMLHAAIEELRADAPELHAVVRGYLDGMSIPRVAAALAIPEGTAWTRWRLGCEAVRARFRRWAAEEAAGAMRTRRRRAGY